MAGRINRAEQLVAEEGAVAFEADVLVLGGGPAGAWAAVSAAQRGARVVLADKGFCGTSGATAAAGTGVWYIDPDPALREAAMAGREKNGGYLQDRRWMARTLDRTYALSNQLAAWGYPYPTDASGRPQRNSLQGPEYMRLMRRRVKQAGVTILDHSPALELLRDDDGAVAGAAGIRRQKDDRWVVHAGAVVIATGGCAFLSKTLGSNVLTGDGYLLGAEIGAELTSMEFSNPYAISPAFGSVTKTLFYGWATFTYEDGSVVPGAASKGGRSAIARALLNGPVYAQLDKADAATQAAMRVSQPNFFLPLDRTGIDPFTERFPVTLRLEGTVRGTGGLRIVDDSCATTVPGLYAAGDAATRELICGGFTGGGSHNAAWAMSSGFWAGEGAADHARRRGAVRARPAARAGTVGLRRGSRPAVTPAELAKAVQGEVFPYELNYFRDAGRLDGALARLDTLWRDVSEADAASQGDALRSREAAAMLATARWMYRSALARTETRGMHRREDYTELDPRQRHYITTGGLDAVWTSSRPHAEAAFAEAAE
ncbi:FAD-binding protein [Bradyrhizobium sp. U87765 SZCCT0131]|uniref:FAD-dependent oxidoreductase n=1 Tax=unclassified Bradyrhizobium TaxID=2631580 RepID=UPI001BA5E5F5|nr:MULTISPECIES: FAD-binding protein [unclassified Bradyrhizobium]MBR1218899.1 FAD-binding protein [Bradyrhizobium sp. U87765 SZCCT0131]MBR1261550.1 FAD-binding protein [Bradyrhizobium sp. U87765 SZCCT0134]MBR1306597.1 FAD-binding protein [Bradyrhizobium sp. U87765 SZCCT0110]MBR1317332.1 FAD-binding protein [Bradyrhizobium sp. U87765 SZCCT0109]MBR1351034.1 FAD-binding protein [Bradyrhizobium sp. U87765 SZCCT0048]